jgi:anthranilate synthase component I
VCSHIQLDRFSNMAPQARNPYTRKPSQRGLQSITMADVVQIDIEPTLGKVEDVLSKFTSSSDAPNMVPLCASIPADLLTPTLAYLRISAGSKFSFLYESAATTGTIGRYSFVGADPLKVLKTGQGHGRSEDPLPRLQEELSQFRVATIPSVVLPPLTGGGIGYVGYDCVKYFEPKTARPAKDVLGLPESLFMIFDTIVAFDHFFNVCKVIAYLRVPEMSGPSALKDAYEVASTSIRRVISTLSDPETPLPPQGPIQRDQTATSNIGQPGYSAHVEKLKKHIKQGDIIQAVPSHRIARPTTLHPFNIYRNLRTVNPSPYLFYIDCADFSIVGASPELLVKEEAGRIITHPIAGTVKRGLDPDHDEQLAEELRNSAKDRAEHVMLVDLARNDVNRVCDPLSTRVDRLMTVEKFSHVQHLVSQVSGILRPGKTRWDAFRSIFPAGTVSGAPKVRAMELIAELETERRGIYAGAVGYFGFSSLSLRQLPPDSSANSTTSSTIVEHHEGAMDTCIALRTMVVRDGVAYLQAGGGIVFDSIEEDEWQETMNKLGANLHCITAAEERYLSMEGEKEGS